jgi:hypothetical protein
MTGTVIVNATGTTTTAGTTTPPQTTSNGSGQATSGSGSSGQAGSGSSPTAPVSLAGNAVDVPSRQRGKTVHGSVDIPQSGTGGRLEVDLIAARASLAGSGRSAPVRVGRVARSNLASGMVRFAVPLNARGRSALARHRRLTLTVRILLTPLSGSPARSTRSVLLRR